MLPRDFSEAADVGSKAFWNDELFGWLCEARVDHPEHFRNLFLRSIGRNYHHAGSHWVVVETESDSKGNKNVVGYARWEREGNSPSAKEWQRDSLYKRKSHMFPTQLFNLIVSQGLNEAFDTLKMNTCESFISTAR